MVPRRLLPHVSEFHMLKVCINTRDVAATSHCGPVQVQMELPRHYRPGAGRGAILVGTCISRDTCVSGTAQDRTLST